MPALTEYTYIFVIALFACALDAYNIGANDVANSFATSVSSKSLTLRQACLAAAVMEAAGAITVGARVADTIKNGIINPAMFQGNPGVQMLTFTCALVVSASWLMVATRMSWPVSTTYSIVSAVAGAGVAVGGVDQVNWGWNGGKGLATIFAGFGIAPALAGGFGAVCYLLVKFGVLRRKNPLPYALATGPIVFFIVSAVMTMSIIYKGSPSLGLDDMPGNELVAAILGTAAVVAALAALFWVPFVYCKVVRKDYTLRFYHFFLGPLLWKRQAPADAGEVDYVADYRIRKDEDETPVKADEESGSMEKRNSDDITPATLESPLNKEVEKVDEHPIVGSWIEPKNLYIIARYKTVPFVKKVLFHGSSVDVHAMQEGAKGSAQAARQHALYARAKQYPNEVEATYSFVQVLTACVASFAHGANDVSNAIGPFAAIYHVWSTGELAGKKSAVPIWILIFGAAMIVIGLATYGYNIMAVLGNKVTLMSPSRGFCMELGAAITVCLNSILASQYGLPVSTTMCIVGATIGVGLCNGDLKAVNWRAIGHVFLGWVLTVPIVGTLSGVLTGLILNAPHFTS
ncbi:hypothetical protein OIO90_002751 [Microbotryomycetes sp. JL221]|nr:hypothetical protein OIO90_002751 [Microbotryomycetes sp. JL221]